MQKSVKKDKSWKVFELECSEYLNNIYGNKNLIFKRVGSSKSNVSDIQVVQNSKGLFYIESKMKKSQSGQFVLLIEDNKFTYSSANKDELNEHVKEIIYYINSKFDNFKDVEQSTKKIDLSTSIFEKWIISHYKSLGTKFIITEDNNEKIIFPIEQIGKYFKITCNLRRKKSGSRYMPKKDLEKVSNYLKKRYDKFISISYIDKKPVVNFNNTLETEFKFSIEEDNYKISLEEDSSLGIVRKLSKTNNPTIIFSLELYNNVQSEDDLQKFINIIKKA